jgi:CspA family cold shock protein
MGGTEINGTENYVKGRTKGRVKFFNTTKGFGFITPEDGSKDHFVHITGLADPRAQLQEGDEVEYEFEQGQRGPQACRGSVQVVN